MVVTERRQKNVCNLDKRTIFFLHWWPTLAGVPYLIIGLWPSVVFGNGTDQAYAFLGVIVFILGIASSIFWLRWPILRNLMASTAFARSTSAVIGVPFAINIIDGGAMARMFAVGCFSLFFFWLATVEIPFLNNLKGQHNDTK